MTNGESLPFMLDQSGKCTTCAHIPSPLTIVTCASCVKPFHGYCTSANDNNFISKQTFMKSWHSPSVKSNFQWHCDSCKTRMEENAASTMEDRLDRLLAMVGTLSNELISVKKTMGDELDTVKAKLQEVSESVVNKTMTTSSASDAAAPQSPWHDTARVKNIRSSLVLRGKAKPTETEKEADLEKLKSLAVSNNIPVSRVGHDSSGNTYIDCPTAEDSSLLQPLLTENFQDKEVSVIKPKLPCVTIVGIQDEVTNSNFSTLVSKQNPMIDGLISSGEELSVVFVKSVSDGSFTVVAKVSAKIRDALRSMQNRVFLGISSCRVYDRFFIKRCNKCQEFGHYKADCPYQSCRGHGLILPWV